MPKPDWGFSFDFLLVVFCKGAVCTEFGLKWQINLYRDEVFFSGPLRKLIAYRVIRWFGVVKWCRKEENFRKYANSLGRIVFKFVYFNLCYKPIAIFQPYFLKTFCSNYPCYRAASSILNLNKQNQRLNWNLRTINILKTNTLDILQLRNKAAFNSKTWKQSQKYLGNHPNLKTNWHKPNTKTK